MSKSVLGRQPDGTIQLTITIPHDEVRKIHDTVFDKIVADAKIPGFRQGKAPKKLVEEKTDRAKIYEQVIQEVLPKAYLEAVKEHHLEPIVSPKIELLKVPEEGDWEIRTTTCEFPTVTLGDYKAEIRKALAPTKIWTPGTPQPPNRDQDNTEEKTQKAIQATLQAINLVLPNILIEEQLNKALANLISQAEKLGLTIDQYLASVGKSAEQLRAEYQKKVEDDLKLQFILDEIAKKEGIEIPDKEVDDLLHATGDEKIKKDLNNPAQRAYLKHILARRKTLELLTGL